MSAEECLERGKQFLEKGLTLAAIEFLENARALEPGKPEVLFHLSEAYLKRQRLGKARRCLEAIVSGEPQWNNGAAAGALKRVDALIAGLEENFRACRAMLRHDKFCAEAFYSLGRLHLRRGEYDEAIVNFEAAGSGQWDAEEVFFGLGEARLETGDCVEALECFDKAIESDPGLDHLWFYRAVALRRLGRLGEALEAVDKALAIYPDGADARWLRDTIIAEIASRGDGDSP